MKHLQEGFKVKLFEEKFFLGLEIQRKADGSIFIGQKAYANKVIARFNMQNSSFAVTPADSSTNLSNFGKNDADLIKFPYREAVGSLMYLAVATRPDIAFAVSNVSRYLEKPTEGHIKAVKRILRYINGTISVRIFYNSSSNIELRGYSDADYAGDTQTRKSTSGFVFMIGDGVVSWCSERQKCISLSTTEAEYIAASSGIKELVWLRNFWFGLGGPDKIVFCVDNQSAIRLIKNPEFHKRTKHIDVRYHYIRDKYEEQVFELQYVNSTDQLADGLAKALPKISNVTKKWEC